MDGRSRTAQHKAPEFARSHFNQLESNRRHRPIKKEKTEGAFELVQAPPSAARRAPPPGAIMIQVAPGDRRTRPGIAASGAQQDRGNLGAVSVYGPARPGPAGVELPLSQADRGPS